jgi:spore maturation protein CgeB
MKKMLYVGLLYNYGKEAEGPSYEHMNVEAGIRDCVQRGMFEADFWYPDKPEGTALDRVLENQYDAIFHVAFNESLDLPEDAAKMALKKGTAVIQWDCDSSWRFNHWILPRKDRVSHFITTHSATMPWYVKYGMNIIKSQWGGSPLYQSSRILYQYDASFVGQKHGQMPNGKFLRSEVIDAMIAAGISIDLFGNYWDGYKNWHGYQTDFNDIIRVFDTTRVNLNLSNPWHHGTMPQIKGRHFEIPQVGGFQISTPADDLLSYFVEDKEIVIAHSVDELIEKTKFYIEHSNEREKIAKAGNDRMMAEHQWYHRFTKMFQEVGIEVEPSIAR